MSLPRRFVSRSPSKEGGSRASVRRSPTGICYRVFVFDFRRLWQLAPACAYALYLRFCDSILIKSFFSYRVFAAPEAAAGVECGCLVRRFFVQLREEILGSGDLLPRRLRSRSCMHEGGEPALVRCRCFLQYDFSQMEQKNTV